jgi:3-oxoacyl-[acyl-carrier protein] reductase
MDLGIKGKTALVLGAGGGLGSAIAKSLAIEGSQVAVADINKEAAEKTVADIQAIGGSAMAVGWDLGDLSAIEPNL